MNNKKALQIALDEWQKLHAIECQAHLECAAIASNAIDERDAAVLELDYKNERIGFLEDELRGAHEQLDSLREAF